MSDDEYHLPDHERVRVAVNLWKSGWPVYQAVKATNYSAPGFMTRIVRELERDRRREDRLDPMDIRNEYELREWRELLKNRQQIVAALLRQFK